MKIVEGLHVEDVGFGRFINVLVRARSKRDKRPAEETEAFNGKNIASIIWQPTPENWMAAEIMRVLLTKKESE